MHEKKYTAMVADDHPIFRKGLIDILKEIRQLEIIAEVADGLSAYRQIVLIMFFIWEY